MSRHHARKASGNPVPALTVFRKGGIQTIIHEQCDLSRYRLRDHLSCEPEGRAQGCSNLTGGNVDIRKVIGRERAIIVEHIERHAKALEEAVRGARVLVYSGAGSIVDVV